MALRIVNLNQWRDHLFARLQQQLHNTFDASLQALLTELQSYPGQPDEQAHHLAGEHLGVLMPFPHPVPLGCAEPGSAPPRCSGSPTDITLQELALETFFPGDEATAQTLHALAAKSTTEV